MQGAKGKVVSVNESLVGVQATEGAVMNGEVAYIVIEDGKRLKSEVIDVKKGNLVFLQVFEDTSWMKVGDIVEFTGSPLAVKLGPGILGSVTDGLQNPLYELGEIDWFLERGLEVAPLDAVQKWTFTPQAKKGDILTGGSVLGKVPEKLFEHKIFVPFWIQEDYVLEDIVEEGAYTVDEPIATLRNAAGHTKELKMAFDWPVKQSMPFSKRAVPEKPLPTGIRILDALFPIAYGGTACNPGPFGAGKTVLQHSLARHSQADIVIIAACGERAGEAVEVFKDFPKLDRPADRKIAYGSNLYCGQYFLYARGCT